MTEGDSTFDYTVKVMNNHAESILTQPTWTTLGSSSNDDDEA